MARKRGNRYQADFTHPDGSRERPSFENEQAANAWEAAAALAAHEGKPIPSPDDFRRGPSGGAELTTLGNLFDHVSKTRWAKLRSAAHATRNGKTAVEYFGRNKDVRKLSSSDIDKYTEHLGSTGLSPATINRKTAALSGLLKAARDDKIISTVPPIKWNREIQTKFRWLTDEEDQEVVKYLDAVEPTFGTFAMFMTDTGARCYTEALPVDWEHFGKDFKTVTFWNTKTNRPRTVPLTSRLRARLQGQSKTGRGPFRRITEARLRSVWDNMRQNLKMHDVTPHTLRHTCCTRLVLGGADVKRVMEWMGHTSIQTTMRYMQLRPDSLDDIVGILER